MTAATHATAERDPGGETRGRRRVCIVSRSHIARDGRVTRQIEFLAPHYDLTVLGYGDPDPAWPPLQWVRLPEGHPAPPAGSALVRRARTLLRLAFGRLVPSLNAPAVEGLYLQGPIYDALQAVRADLYLANDWNTLPPAAEAARRHGGKLVFDAHEYGPLEWEDSLVFRWRDAPVIDYLLRRYAPRCDGSVTVCAPIAERYQDVYGLRPIVVRNVPKSTDLPARSRQADGAIRLVHHGGANPERRLDLMIDALARADERYTLTLMLVGRPADVERLRDHAARVAPGRVFFIDPVPPPQIAARIAEFDMGIFLLETRIYNYAVALPNKLFEFIMAGLAVCVGPSPGMAGLVREYDCGVVARSVGADDVAAALRAVDHPALERMREGARRARLELNAENEMRKLTDLIGSLLPGTVG